MESRRTFIRFCSILAGTSLISAGIPVVETHRMRRPLFNANRSDNAMKLRYKPYELQLKHTFTIAEGSRTTTPVMLTEISWGNYIGYGEASMPPYLPENHATTASFLAKIDLSRFRDPLMLEEILHYIDQIAPGNYAAKASADIALHDLAGKIMGQPWYKIWGLNPAHTPYTSFTIGIDKPDVVQSKTLEAAPYKILKVKLGKGNDRELIGAVRSVTDKPLCVDVNQGWTDRQNALDEIEWLKEKGVVLIEQPMDKSSLDDASWLTERSPLPIIADEAFQTLADLKKISGAYSGINVKLMKCGGMHAAYAIIEAARAFGLKIMIGCMTETSCAVSAAAQLSPLADWADLDGNLLIRNDPFKGVEVKDGRIILPELPGIGVTKI